MKREEDTLDTMEEEVEGMRMSQYIYSFSPLQTIRIRFISPQTSFLHYKKFFSSEDDYESDDDDDYDDEDEEETESEEEEEEKKKK